MSARPICHKKDIRGRIGVQRSLDRQLAGIGNRCRWQPVNDIGVIRRLTAQLALPQAPA